MREDADTRQNCLFVAIRKHGRTRRGSGAGVALFFELDDRRTGGDFDFAVDDGALGDGDGARAYPAVDHGAEADLELVDDRECALDASGNNRLLRLDMADPHPRSRQIQAAREFPVAVDFAGDDELPCTANVAHKYGLCADERGGIRGTFEEASLGFAHPPHYPRHVRRYCDELGGAARSRISSRIRSLKKSTSSVKMVTKKVLWVLPLVACLALAGCSRQQSDWEKTRAANTTDAYEVFLKKYPSGEFSAQAQARVKELYEERDWLKARDTDTADAYQAFLKQYPEGKYTEEARIRVENFTLAATPNGAAPADGSAAPAETTANTAASAPAPSPAPPKPAAAAVPKATTPNSGGAYGVQLGAFKSNADAAHQRWIELAKTYPKTLSALTPKVSPKKTSAGTLYRLQVLELSEHQARAICKALGSSPCVVLKPGHG